MTLPKRHEESPESGVFVRTDVPDREEGSRLRPKPLPLDASPFEVFDLGLDAPANATLESAALHDARARERDACLRALMRTPLSFVDVSVRALCDYVSDRVYDRAEAKGTDVVFHCTSDRIWVQPAAFSLAMYELVENAVTATRECHPVMIDVRTTPMGDVLFQICDAGKGMPRDVLVRLQGRLRPTRLRGEDGGLSFAWRVIDKHGGVLRFESGADVGTTATVWLPGRN